MEKYCPHCGVPVPDDSMFCQGCGSNLSSCGTNVTQGQRNKKSDKIGAGDMNRTVRILNIILAVLAVIQLIIICFVTPGWFSHGDGVRDRSAVSSSIEWESR